MTDHSTTFDATIFSQAYAFDDAASSSGGFVGKVASWGLMASGMLGVVVTGAPLPNTLGPQQHIMRVEGTSSTSGDAFWLEAAAFIGASYATGIDKQTQKSTQRVLGE